jgi:hypothetical protein
MLTIDLLNDRVFTSDRSPASVHRLCGARDGGDAVVRGETGDR